MDHLKTTADLGYAADEDWTRIQEKGPGGDDPGLDTAPAPPPERGGASLVLRIAVVLTLAAMVIGSHVVLLSRIQELEANALNRSVIAQGLGLDSSTDRDIALVLANLRAVSIDSDTWHTSIEERGMDPEEFLGRLLRFAERSDEAYRMAAYSDQLVRLGGREADLMALAQRRSSLTDLSGETDPLITLAERLPHLTKLAERAEELCEVAQIAPSIQHVASHEPFLVELAQREEQLADLVEVSPALVKFVRTHLTTTQLLAENSAGLLELVQLRSDSLNRLSESESVLLALAAQQHQLSRLAHQHARLLEYARAEKLPRLDRVATQLEILAAHSDELLSSLDDTRAAAAEGS